MAAKPIFRQEAIDRMQSPDELGSLLTLVECRTWLMLGAVGFICFSAVGWSVLGSIPVTVDGIGVLINPGSVKSLQSTAAGQIVEVRVRVGQEVKQGETVIALLNQPDLQTQLDQERQKLDALLRDHKLMEGMDDERLSMQREFVKQQKAAIDPELERTNVLASGIAERNSDFLEQQEEALDETRARTVDLNDVLKKRAASVTALSEEGLLADDVALASQREATENELKVANLDVQLQELKLRSIEAELADLGRRNRVAELKFKLLELEISEKQTAQEVMNARLRRHAERDELERSIKRIEELLGRQGAILSSFDGRILEITVSAGQVINAGTRIGALEVDSGPGSLKNLAYFQVADGKRIREGDRIHVTPSTIQRERYGSILGTVTSVSSFPITQEAAANVVGNAEVAQALMQRGGAIEIEASLEEDPDSVSGFRWTSVGPPVKFSAGTTTSVRVTIERRSPISYVLPILRTWVLGEKDEKRPQ